MTTPLNFVRPKSGQVLPSGLIDDRRELPLFRYPPARRPWSCPRGAPQTLEDEQHRRMRALRDRCDRTHPEVMPTHARL